MRREAPSEGMLLAIDKDPGCTSHDVVGGVRRALGLRKVGHAGTLDPAATGVMVVGIGTATRLLGLLTADSKGYVAEIAFGRETTTDDAEGEVVRTEPVPAALTDAAFAAEALASIVGPSMQVPPAYSAIKVGGKRSYARARSGESFELEARPVEIFDATLLSVVADEDGTVLWQVALTVSKGCYVRAIARDLGRALGTVAHLTRLRRTSSGSVRLSECLRIEELKEGGMRLARERCLDPAAKLALPRRDVSAQELSRVRDGRAISVGSVSVDEGGRVSVCAEGKLFGIWERRAGHLVPAVNFALPVLGVRS